MNTLDESRLEFLRIIYEARDKLAADSAVALGSTQLSETETTPDVWQKLKKAVCSLHYDADGRWIDKVFSLKQIAELAKVKATALDYQFRTKLYPNSNDTAKAKYERAVESTHLKKLLDAERDSGRVFKRSLPKNS